MPTSKSTTEIADFSIRLIERMQIEQQQQQRKYSIFIVICLCVWHIA